MGGVVPDLDIQDRCQSPESLGADPEFIHLVVNLQSQFFRAVGGAFGL